MELWFNGLIWAKIIRGDYGGNLLFSIVLMGKVCAIVGCFKGICKEFEQVLYQNDVFFKSKDVRFKLLP